MKLKKVALGITVVLIVLFVLAILAVLGFNIYDSIAYGDFYDVANEEFYIPGLMDGYVPQGFDYVKEEKVFIACGYMSNDEASRVYVISEDGDDFYYTELMKKNGDPYKGHTGGIAYWGNYAYITGSDGIDVFYLSDILDEDVKEAANIGTIYTSSPSDCDRCGDVSCDEHKGNLDIDPAFCFVYGGFLYTGEYYSDSGYPTPEEHHIKTPSGETNTSLMVAYALAANPDNASNNKLGIYGQFDKDSFGIMPTPDCAFSLPSLAQGACVAKYERLVDGKMQEVEKLVVSTSYGISPSNIYFYDLEKVLGTTTTNEVLTNTYGVTVPLYFICADSLEKTVEAPPMAEEIVYHDGKIWIMNESASNKYIFGKLTTGNTLFSFDYPTK